MRSAVIQAIEHCCLGEWSTGCGSGSNRILERRPPVSGVPLHTFHHSTTAPRRWKCRKNKATRVAPCQKWRARSQVCFPDRTFSLFSLIYMFVFLTEFQGCGARIVTEGQGELTSPNYPHQWESGGNCSWVIVGASQCKWRRLVFKVASLQVCPISL